MVVKADFDVAFDVNYHVDFDASMRGASLHRPPCKGTITFYYTVNTRKTLLNGGQIC